MNLYRSMERILNHLVLVAGGWLLKMLKIVPFRSLDFGVGVFRV